MSDSNQRLLNNDSNNIVKLTNIRMQSITTRLMCLIPQTCLVIVALFIRIFDFKHQYSMSLLAFVCLYVFLSVWQLCMTIELAEIWDANIQQVDRQQIQREFKSYEADCHFNNKLYNCVKILCIGLAVCILVGLIKWNCSTAVTITLVIALSFNGVSEIAWVYFLCRQLIIWRKIRNISDQNSVVRMR